MAAHDSEERIVVNSFYRAFEDRYRGSRELIAKRLQVYLPFIRPLVVQSPNAIALDLGCGRGEWLDLVSSEGFHALGVDLDEGMLSACRERGMDVQQRDALDMLRSLSDTSVSVVSAFHVVEHIPFDDVRELIAEARRVLVPGGLLIMETPNPENIVVAGSRFYMDPTHLKPLPPQLLSFAAEYAGFERVKILRLQERQSLHDPAATITLLNVLEDVSPDYSVVAQKGGDDVVLANTASAFETEYGLTLPALVARHARHADAPLLQIKGAMEVLEESMRAVQERVALAEAKAVDAQKEATQVQAAVHAAIQHALEDRDATAARIAEFEARALRAEAIAHQYFAQLEEIHASTSWRVTAPLRRAGVVVHALRRDPVKSNAKRALRHIARYVRRQPWLATPALRLLKRFPRLKQRLALIVDGFELHPVQSSPVIPSDAAHLTQQAREIYADFKAALARRNKEEG
ncbi:class I SAM-dependent methyltransferase [Burkholderia multivorans]|uniref:class I SAM-dependent methyltransferase n=1 Tax=Burkholderia multivorans TaxID=87883 RepID=UPI00158C70C3|nr:class I SAM-dependent methyltransferase [Burkholderia multivorans]